MNLANTWTSWLFNNLENAPDHLAKILPTKGRQGRSPHLERCIIGMRGSRDREVAQRSCGSLSKNLSCKSAKQHKTYGQIIHALPGNSKLFFYPLPRDLGGKKVGDPHSAVNRSLRLDVHLDVHLVVQLDVHLELHQFWNKDGNGTTINCFFQKIKFES